eukprot:scaffold917_cov168-Ochromonas_danica.AAC.24
MAVIRCQGSQLVENLVPTLPVSARRVALDSRAASSRAGSITLKSMQDTTGKSRVNYCAVT